MLFHEDVQYIVFYSRIWCSWGGKNISSCHICREQGLKEVIYQQRIDYRQKVLRSPACVMATSVLVTEVPMLVPMIMGTASWTVSTAEAHWWLSSTVPSPTIWMYVCECASVGLTSRGDHANNYRGGGGRALDQQGDQDADDHTSQRVGQDGVVLKDVACCFTWTHKHGRSF